MFPTVYGVKKYHKVVLIPMKCRCIPTNGTGEVHKAASFNREVGKAETEAVWIKNPRKDGGLLTEGFSHEV
ncbi:hypothetical protein CC1G_14267 [Coprinopsis cinerea okayama7|uniref:Uncharacterized protein n=1 Tax=Coprinopsis cinerea (strain Okayama-7 / 130 / ATCC MYA-4618 / FGSC 9003) TaxID=240176 RepID=D6RLF8_COPC7|nr:hypothetical protein CC1G_14267 [Coprinopsis cinerea okayama7\|eukprot:XP_002911736.1 hypothetical protein CC1G_14267 [Coprinopsis cinerea okayama7\